MIINGINKKFKIREIKLYKNKKNKIIKMILKI